MRYADYNRNAYLKYKLEEVIHTLYENNQDPSEKLINYIKNNKVSKKEASSIAHDYVNKYIEKGGSVNTAKQGLNTLTSRFKDGAVGLVMLAAAIGTTLVGFNNIGKNASTDQINQQLSSSIQQMTTQVTPQEIQNLTQDGNNLVIPSEQATKDYQELDNEVVDNYTIRKGDTYWDIATRHKPENVEQKDYVKVLQQVNDDKKLVVGASLTIPQQKDLKDYILPELNLKFDLYDPELVQNIKEDEGTYEGQSKIKRRLLNGTGSPAKGGKFYPYQDSHGNWTIGYGHLIGTSSSKAVQYQNGISKSEAEKMLKRDMEKVYQEFQLMLKRQRITDLPVDVEKALYEMSFNMGTGKVVKFTTMWKHLKNNDYKNASNAIYNSAWRKQISSDRFNRIATAMANETSNNEG